MIRFIIVFYLIIFGIYLLFSRQPDFFDGEIVTATIHFKKDSVTAKKIPFAEFQSGKEPYSFNATYLFKKYNDGEKVAVIYEASQPQYAAIYGLWGYWIGWGELLVWLIGCFILFQIAKMVTNNPVPEAVIDQLDKKEMPKRKYD